MKRRGGGLAIERVSIEGWGGFKPSAHNQGILLEYETLTSFLIFIKIDLLRAQICKKMFWQQISHFTGMTCQISAATLKIYTYVKCIHEKRS